VSSRPTKWGLDAVEALILKEV
jgi:hypothetical protein